MDNETITEELQKETETLKQEQKNSVLSDELQQKPAPKKEKLWNAEYTKAWTANFMLYFSFMLVVPILPLYLSDTYGADSHM